MVKDILRYPILGYALKKFPDRKLFCPIPFKQMEITLGGHTNLCCYIKKSPGIVKTDSLIDIYNSSSAQEIRGSILDGTFKYCNLDACPHFSSGDLPLHKNCEGTPYESIIRNNLTVLDKMNIWLSFDSRCNLRCISCRKDLVKYSETEHQNTEKLLDIIKINLPRIKQIGLCGNGDPFASPSIRNFLYNFNASDYPDIKITILTNGLLFNEHAWESMKKGDAAIKSVQVSIDAASKETYESIRVGGSFDRLMNNLSFISQLRKRNIINEFIISFVVNAKNFNEMDAFVNLGLKLGCDQVYFSYMVDWGVLSKEEYAELAIHLQEHKMHKQFKRKLEDTIINNSIVNLGNIRQFKSNRILRDSLFS